MTLWDQTNRIVAALPAATNPSADVDFIPVVPSGAGVQRVALRGLRSPEVFSFPMFTTANGVGVTANTIGTTTARTALRQWRIPFNFRLLNIVITCTQAGAGNTTYDLWVNIASIVTGNNAAINNIVLNAGSLRAVHSIFTLGFPGISLFANDDLLLFVGTTETTIVRPYMHLHGYRE